MTSMALVVGLGGGLGTVLFRKAIDAATAVFFGQAVTLPPAVELFLPALGGLVVGLWMYVLSPKGPGQGVAGIMEAVALHGGRIEPRGAIARIVGAIITIGSGGSAGPEDPSVQIGATVGSLVSQFFRLSETRIRTLVGCGTAAGLAAAFNAPIAGVFFAIEIVLGEFSSAAIGFVVMSAVAGAVVSQTFLGSAPAFRIPVYELTSPWELFLYALLGVLAALVAVLYINSLKAIETLVERTPNFPKWFKPALGGLAVGLIGFFIHPGVFGIGYSVIGNALQNPPSDLLLLLALVFAKLFATTLTLGSGGQGGLFAPSLFLGAMLGLAFGLAVDAFFSLQVPPAAYGLVGMAAVLAGAVRAPITAIVLPFEMTNDYRIIVPLMAAATISYLVSQHFQPDSVYTQKLHQRGVDLRAQRNQDLMTSILVRDAMTPPGQMVTVPETMTIQELSAQFQKTGRHGFPVVDARGELAGIVTLQDLERAIAGGIVEGSVADISTREVITAYPDESLGEALGHLKLQDVGRIPVVDRWNPTHMLGVLRRSDILTAYAQAFSQETERARRNERLKLEGMTGAQFVEIDLTEVDGAVGKKLNEIRLPPDAVLVSIRRGNRTIIPHGNTTFGARDRVFAAVLPEHAAELRQALKQPPTKSDGKT